jgi:hypothetical protein
MVVERARAFRNHCGRHSRAAETDDGFQRVREASQVPALSLGQLGCRRWGGVRGLVHRLIL